MLARVAQLRDLKKLPARDLPALAADIRDFLVTNVSKTGGHLGPNLGVVELTIALHRVFNSPIDTIVFDTGHQAYVHKILTGRKDFSHLRSRGGLSGYPSRAESVHDVLENTHASAGPSWAAGVAAGRNLQGQSDRFTVVVVGDGALTGGMAWEALNNIAAEKDRRLVVVVNDNGRSYAPTIGALARHLSGLRTAPKYEKVLSWGTQALQARGRLGRRLYEALHGLKKGVKDVVAPQAMFEDLGLKYIGAVDGHDIGAVERSLVQAKVYGGPVIVHVITEKGRGYQPAEANRMDHHHAVGRIHPETGLPLAPERFGWTGVFSDELVRLGRRNDKVVAVTAAMLDPVGLVPFAAEFPDRVFDVGIAEQHAAAMAAGLAYTGLHPVVAVYATFMNRAFDQVLMDCGLHRAGVTFVLDRAGLTGSDGPSHNGQWDLALFHLVPGLRLAAPRDAVRLRQQLAEAIAVVDAPTVLRYPKGPAPDDIKAVGHLDGVDILAAGAGDERVLVVAVGAEARTALDAAALLGEEGISVKVVDPGWIYPVNPALVQLAAAAEVVVTIEDGLASGGFGDALAATMAEAGVNLPVVRCGLPTAFFGHASRPELAKEHHLIPADIAKRARSALGEWLVPRS
ncbi:MAG: 1-deoxy-D-xylulose-5-phosphate synthase [Micrococcales bacterium]|nr:1-deoxy-D-xylulose-5-phosphate synthase [Micrococcales bacterium]